MASPAQESSAAEVEGSGEPDKDQQTDKMHSTTTTSSTTLNLSQQQLENVKVAVRLRPFTEREKQRNGRRIVDIEQNTVVLYSPKYSDTSMKKFTFDFSYWSHDGFKRNQDGVNVPDPSHPNANKYVGQEKVFEDLGAFLLENALQGYNSALLAYGQTGSGKSYTVSGYGKNEGILPRFARSLFAELDKRAHQGSEPAASHNDPGRTLNTSSNGPANGGQEAPRAHQQHPELQGAEGGTKNRYEVYFSMIEIYNEVVRDLLAKSGAGQPAANLARRGLKVREHPKRGFFVEGLSSYLCSNKDEIESRIEEGQLNKSIAATSMNETSSRGHTIYEFRLKQFRLRDALGPASCDNADNETLTTSVVQLVDLAGSERLAVHVTGQLGGDSFIGGRSSSPFGAQDPASSQAPTPTSSSNQFATRRVRSTRMVSQQQQAQPRAARGGQNQPNSASSTASSSLAAGQGLRRTGAGHSSSLYVSDHNHQQRFKESVSINQSLSALGNCIQVLSQYSQQQQQQQTDTASTSQRANSTGNKLAPKIPYRDSVLTKLLNRCCLSGNSKVVIIATLSPADANYDDTLSTLRFADRAKQIRTHATINMMSRREIVNVLQKENERLKQLIDGRVTRSDDSSQTSNFDDSENMIDNFNGPRGTKVGESARDKNRHRTTKRVPDGRLDTNISMRSSPARKIQEEDDEEAKTLAKNTRANKSVHGRKATKGKGSRSIGLAGASVSNPTLNEQLQGLVSPASKKLLGKGSALDSDEKLIKKSRSIGAGLAQIKKQDTTTLGVDGADDDGPNDTFIEGDNEDGAVVARKNVPLDGKNLIVDELDLVTASNLLLDEIELADLIDIEQGEGLLSPDSDDSFAALAEEGLTQEEKIGILNRLLSDSSVADKIRKQYERRRQGTRSNRQTNRIPRPRQANASDENANLTKMSAISSSLKKTNPYLSNLNPDEQLTGMITYIIKQGETILGKNNDCDITLYGPELRGRHAKIIRLEQPLGGSKVDPGDSSRKSSGVKLSQVFIEPIFDNQPSNSRRAESEKANNNATSGRTHGDNVALMVNGMPLISKIQLHHCDRLLFGSNAYFVYIDQVEANQSGGLTIANQDLVTYDMAHNEVLRKVMSDAKNEAVIKEIKDYTHRPGTGKHKDPKVTSTTASVNKPSDLGGTRPKDGHEAKLSTVKSSRLTRSMTINGEQEISIMGGARSANIGDRSDEPMEASPEEKGSDGDAGHTSDSEINIYRDKLMEDTYEYAMPVAEVNAIAKEMQIKVNYGLKILTGEEQLPEIYNYLDGSDSLSSVSGSTGGASEQVNQTQQRVQSTGQPSSILTIYEDATRNSPVITDLIKPDSLDIPPALYIHVHLEEQDMDFYWSKEKFQARRFRILELYGAWDVGGKSGLVEYLIEQSKYQGDYVIDPFIDDPQSSQVLIGHAQVSLKPLSHRGDVNDSFDILDLNDEIVGSMDVQAVPCHVKPMDGDSSKDRKKEASVSTDELASSVPFKPLSELELETSLVENPKELLAKRLVFLIRILSCRNLPKRYCNVYCQYTLNRDKSFVRTNLARCGGTKDEQLSNLELDDERENNGGPNSGTHSQANGEAANEDLLRFNHLHYVTIETVDQDVLDFLEHGFLAIQVVGRYAINHQSNPDMSSHSATTTSGTIATMPNSTKSSASPTLITTIINSINKYKYKIEQQGGAFSGMNYTNSIYTNSLTDSANSNRITSSGIMNSGASSVASTSATVNLFDQQNDDDEGANSINGLSQENIIDMILTKRKLDRAENQLHYLKRTINIAEHYNKKHIPVKTVKKLLNSYGHEIESGSLEEMVADVNVKGKSSSSKNSGCIVQ